MNAKEIQQDFVNKYSDYQKMDQYFKDGIKLREEQIRRLEKRRERNVYPHFIEHFLKPLADELCRQYMQDRFWEVLGPFGLNCETSIHFLKRGVPEKQQLEGDNCWSITFRPGDLAKGEFSVVDHSKDNRKFKPGTLGEMNGMNYDTVPMKPDLEWLWQWIQEQNKGR